MQPAGFAHNEFRPHLKYVSRILFHAQVFSTAFNFRHHKTIFKICFNTKRTQPPRENKCCRQKWKNFLLVSYFHFWAKPFSFGAKLVMGETRYNWSRTGYCFCCALLMFMLLLSMKTWLPFVPVPWVILLQQKKVQKQQQAPAVSVNYCYSKTLKLEIYRMKWNRIKAGDRKSVV